MEEKKGKITQKDLSISLVAKLEKWKKEKNYTPEDIKSIINQIEDPVTKLIAQKLLIVQE